MKKNISIILSLIIIACVSCSETDSTSVLRVGEQKTIAAFDNIQKLNVDSSFIYDISTLGIKIIDTLIITDSRNAATGGWNIMNSKWKEIGAFLNRGHAEGEFGSIPSVYRTPFFFENDTLYGIANDNRIGKNYKINMTKTIEDSCLKYTLLHHKIKKNLDRYVYINDKEFLIRENTFKKNVLKKLTLYKENKVVKNDIFDEINKISLNSEDWNVLAAYCDYNQKHDVLLLVYRYFNIINIIQVHGDKCTTIRCGKSPEINDIIKNRHGKDIYEETKLYDDVFAVMDIKDKNRPRIQIYDYEGNPIKEYVLPKPATSFDFDKLNGYLYTHNYEDGEVNRYKATL